MRGDCMSERQDGPEADGVEIVVADRRHLALSEDISAAIREEVQRGGFGLAERPVTVLRERIEAGDALIAFRGDEWLGFCYVRPWEGGKFVSTSALIVRPAHRGRGIARRLKEAALRLCRERHPGAVPFGLSTSESIWNINRRLGFVEVPYARITRDPEFWEACRSCELHRDLLANGGESCRCRATVLPEEDTDR